VKRITSFSILLLPLISACFGDDAGQRGDPAREVNPQGVIETSTTSDADRDGVADIEDNCPSVENSDQADTDDDNLGDQCDDDDDDDSVLDPDDPCPAIVGTLCPIQ